LKVLEVWLRELRRESPRVMKALEFAEHTEQGGHNEQRYVLNELMIALIRKRV
jgi:hypothetical protein